MCKQSQWMPTQTHRYRVWLPEFQGPAAAPGWLGVLQWHLVGAGTTVPFGLNCSLAVPNDGGDTKTLTLGSFFFPRLTPQKKILSAEVSVDEGYTCYLWGLWCHCRKITKRLFMPGLTDRWSLTSPLRCFFSISLPLFALPNIISKNNHWK